MTNDEIVEAVRRMKRTAEMSAEIMRDRQRTGAWEGAEKVARQFDRLAERASDVFAALAAAPQATADYVQVPRAATEEMQRMGARAFAGLERYARDHEYVDAQLSPKFAQVWWAMIAAAPQATDPRERHILVTPDRSHVEVRDMDHAMTLLAEQNIAIDTLTERLTRERDASHPAPDATDWKARCEPPPGCSCHPNEAPVPCPRQHALTHCLLSAAQAENEKLREALKPFADYADPSRRISPHLILTKGSALARRQLTMGDCYAALAALSPPPLSPEKP